MRKAMPTGMPSPVVARPRAAGMGPARQTVAVPAALALLIALASFTVGCGDSRGTAALCGKAERQPPQFPASHVLPGQPEPTYLSEPPTSGPHAPLAEVLDVYDEPLARPTQVGLLEAGNVLVQYRPADVAAADIDRLTFLAGPGLIVAPNDALHAPVVASAWLTLLSCREVDEKALRAFAQTYAGRGPGAH